MLNLAPLLNMSQYRRVPYSRSRVPYSRKDFLAMPTHFPFGQNEGAPNQMVGRPEQTPANTDEIAWDDSADLRGSADGAVGQRLFGRKSLLMAAAASMGVVLAQVAQPPSAAAAPVDLVLGWTPFKAYTLGDQIGRAHV